MSDQKTSSTHAFLNVVPAGTKKTPGQELKEWLQKHGKPVSPEDKLYCEQLLDEALGLELVAETQEGINYMLESEEQAQLLAEMSLVLANGSVNEVLGAIMSDPKAFGLMHNLANLGATFLLQVYSRKEVERLTAELGEGFVDSTKPSSIPLIDASSLLPPVPASPVPSGDGTAPAPERKVD